MTDTNTIDNSSPPAGVTRSPAETPAAPSVILAGAQKAGTSFLHATLEAHPACVAAFEKEPSYFSRWDTTRSDEAWSAYVGDLAGGSPPGVADGLTIDATTAYLPDPEAPRRMAARPTGETRFVFILREPAARAVSAYWHLYKRGDETRAIDHALPTSSGSLDDAIEAEAQRTAGAAARGEIDLARYRERYDDPAWPARYLGNSDYLPQLRRYAEAFGRERMHVVFFERLLREPDAVWSELCGFLGIDPARGRPAVDTRVNPTRLARRSPMARAASRLDRSPIGQRLRRRAPGWERVVTNLRFRGVPDASRAAREAWCGRFAEANDALAAWLDRPLPDAWAVTRRPRIRRAA